MVSSTKLSQELDPEDLHGLLSAYHARCGEVIRRHGGYVAQHLGDGSLAYFGYPLALEDAPSRAIAAGLEVIESVRDMARPLGTGGHPLSLRVGIHTGPVVVGQLGDAVKREVLAVGETPNLAARVQSFAEPNTLVVSEATRRLSQGYFLFRELGEHELKGILQPVALSRVLASTGARSRLEGSTEVELTTFVARARELSLLRARWSSVAAGGWHAVSVKGEPGIGKSRLVLEFRHRLPAPAPTAYSCHCGPLFLSTALFPVVTMLERRMQLVRTQADGERLRRVELELERVGLDLGQAVPLVCRLLGIDFGSRYPRQLSITPQRERVMLFETLLQWVQNSARQQPLVLVFEDVHWADPSTLEFLTLLIGRRLSGVFLLITHRPELSSPWSKREVERLELTRFDSEQSESLIAQVLRDAALPAAMREELRERAEGVPLFLEEMTKATLESAKLPHDARDPRTHPSIPSSLQDSLTARLDRLGLAKSVLQLAAVLGRAFPHDLMAAVSNLPAEDLQRSLDQLVALQLLMRAAGSDVSYVFRHALIQDAAYAMLLRGTRQSYHRQVAEALMQRLPSIALAQPALVAHHSAAGGLPEQAAAQWSAAGLQALMRSAYAEAMQACRQGLEQLSALPRSSDRHLREVELRTTLGLGLIFTRGYSAIEVEENFERAHLLCEELHEVSVGTLYGIWAVYLVRADQNVTARLALKLRQTVDSSSDPFVKRLGASALGVRAFYAGDYELAQDHFASSQALSDLTAGTMPADLERAFGYEGFLYPFLYGAWASLLQGEPERAWTVFEKTLAVAESLHHPNGIAMAVGFGAVLAVDCTGDIEASLQFCEREFAIAAENSFPFWSATAQVHRGYIHARAGRHELALSDLDLGLSLLRAMGGYVLCPLAYCALIDANLQLGRSAEASAALDDALAFCDGKLTGCFAPMLSKLQGDVLAGAGDLVGAERCYRDGLTLAHKQTARLFELQCAHGLAKLLRATDREGEGRALLAEQCAVYSEDARSPVVLAARETLLSLPS